MLGLVEYTERLDRRAARYLPDEAGPAIAVAAPDAPPLPEALLDFIPAISPRFAPPVHLAPIVDALERVLAGEAVSFVAATPPRHAKTETLLHFVAALLRRHPEKTVGYVTYAADLSHSKSRRARALARAAGVELAFGATALGEWRTAEGGGMLATGVGGPLTGQGVDVLIVDDPVKNRVEAESQLTRDRLWEWFNDVGFTRLEPGASVVVNMARWHPDDLAGRLVGQGWTELRLPALDDDDRPLWPERWQADRLRAIKEQVGEYTWASLYQGRPRGRGGAVFRDLYFAGDAPLPDGHRLAIGVDLAYTAKTHADYSVALLLARHGDAFRVLEVQRAQLEAPQFAAVLQEMQRRTGAGITAVIAGTEKGTIDFLERDYGLRIDSVTAKGDKFLRAQPVAAAWNAGQVHVPRGAPWLDAFVTELAGFSGVGDRHDDQVDALAAAHAALVQSVSVWAA